MSAPKIAKPSDYVTYSELLALQDRAERAEMSANLGGVFAARAAEALAAVVAARTRYEHQRAEEQARRDAQAARERWQRLALEPYERVLDKTKVAS